VRTTAIILAAGSGSRMGSEIPKQFMMLCGKPVLSYSLSAFQDSSIEEIIIVTSPEYVEHCYSIAREYGITKLTAVVPGGAERYLSVHEGLKQAPNGGIVFIHDGARALITTELINVMLPIVEKKQAVIAAVPVKDTIKIIGNDGSVSQTPNRNSLWQIQTPQAFYTDVLKEAYTQLFKTEDSQITDDAMIVERYSDRQVYVAQGDYENIKLTTPEDLTLAEIIIKKRLKNN
jgi:2-C-methyl-D-erythritol 4-phosphate cytidylyltransferase